MISAEGFSAPRDPLIGQVIQERYRVMHAIGRGAMGVVYEAQHLLIGRKVALKTMAAHAVSPAGVQRFRREAQAAAAVGSSHVVDVLDMGRLDDGALYIVMEHLDGVDLGFAVALEERFSVGRAIHVLGQLCDALAAIHEAGIIHRDLKPENVFLTTRDGAPDFVKVLDFGVCKFNDAGGRLTATGDTIGTPLFMAPEQVEGRSDCDHRADVYALGALLYFALTGRAPFDAPNLPALFLRICHEPTPSLASSDSSLSRELDAIVQRALSKDPNERFSSCGAFKAALRSLQAGPDEIAATLPGALDGSRKSDYVWGDISAKGRATLVQPVRPWRRRWFDITAVGAGVLAIAASSGGYLMRAHREESSVTHASARKVEPSSSDSPSRPRISPIAELEPAPGPVTEKAPTDAPPAARARSRSRAFHDAPPSLPSPTLPAPTADAFVVEQPLPVASASTKAPAIGASSAAPELHFTRGLKHGL